MFSDRPLRVFLVEDSTVLRDRLTESLNSLSGVQIVGCSDTEQTAINELRGTNCDAVVLDLQLKHGNGFNVLKAIRQSEAADRHTLVIVLTNYAFSLYRHRCLQAGADFFLDKARDYERLEQVLTAAVENKTAVND
jgi:DNA-binding NarL/FixJ family response regulator